MNNISENVTVINTSHNNIDLNIFDNINRELLNQFDELLILPEVGIQKARSILYRYGFSIPTDYVINHAGDEVAFELEQHDASLLGTNVNTKVYLYLIYYLIEARYEFYGEIIDAIELDKILEDSDEEIKIDGF
jgi:hypothetical protein